MEPRDVLKDYHEAGKAWVDAKLKSDSLEEDQKPLLAALMNDIDHEAGKNGEKVSEAKLDRLARGSKQYRDYNQGMVFAKADMLRKRVRFDAIGLYFEARRSEKAMEREMIAKGIFHEGG